MARSPSNPASSKPSSADRSAGGGWKLSPEAFHKLLGALDADLERAGEAYERIRTKLIRLFQWRGCSEPEELVDETMNRVARKIDQGERILSDDPYRYFCGVARLVFHEMLRKQKRQREALEREPWPPALIDDSEEEAERDRLLRCLHESVGELPPQNRRLILHYYQGERGAKIKNRKSLAAELGIPLNALRIRAHRIRVRLETTVSACLDRLSAAGA